MSTLRKKVQWNGLKLSFYAKSCDADPKGDNPKAGADVGKIVNLMAADANRVAMITSGMYFLYGGWYGPLFHFGYSAHIRR